MLLSISNSTRVGEGGFGPPPVEGLRMASDFSFAVIYMHIHGNIYVGNLDLQSSLCAHKISTSLIILYAI